MELPVLVAIIVAGVSLVVLVLHVTGASAPRTLRHADDVIEALLQDYPDAMDGHVLVSADGMAGFVLLDHRKTGIVRVSGRHLATRLVNLAEIASATRDGSSVTLHFRELGWSKLTAAMRDEKEAERLRAHADPSGATVANSPEGRS